MSIRPYRDIGQRMSRSVMLGGVPVAGDRRTGIGVSGYGSSDVAAAGRARLRESALRSAAIEAGLLHRHRPRAAAD